MDREITAPDGRRLAVHEGGDPGGLPVVVHHGTPAAGVLYPPLLDLASEQRIRLIGYDRPGYGDSTRHAGRSVGDCTDDVATIADALGLDRFATWGISGGGPHALASAAAADGRLTAVASLAGVTPYGAEGLDWTAGMGETNHAEFAAALAGEEALRPYLERERRDLLAASPSELVAIWSTLLGGADRDVLSERLAAFLLESERVALRDGVDGWLDDDVAFVRPWGFDIGGIERPVLVVHGDDDRFVPPSHGTWLAERIPGAEAWHLPGDGHLTLYERRVREVHEWLLRQS